MFTGSLAAMAIGRDKQGGLPVFSRTYAEINERLRTGRAVVVTAEEIIPIARELGVRRAARSVDVVTTATYAPMCSSGAFLNFGHADPPIRMSRILLNNVPAYGGIAAVDCYIGATEPSLDRGPRYGGAHVIQALVDGEAVRLDASSAGTDCYPRKRAVTEVKLSDLNQAYLYNPRNCYQNYGAAANTSNRRLHTYMGVLEPDLGNVTYCSAGALSPLLNDPYYRTVGIGTRIFLGGGTGFVAWQGTQHNPARERSANGVPVGGAGTLALVGDLNQMSSRYLTAASFSGYGSTLFVGVGLAIPILDEEMLAHAAVDDSQIFTDVYDYAVPARDRPSLGRFSYRQLRSGQICIRGKTVRTAPISSLQRAREIADVLKGWMLGGLFQLTQPVDPLPGTGTVRPLNVVSVQRKEGVV